ncbi:MAG: hypothetical protein JXJ17_13575 [Anaerolineae bacterium]|nr:hypothetical protein [Anaerolineae bacterium]
MNQSTESRPNPILRFLQRQGPTWSSLDSFDRWLYGLTIARVVIALLFLYNILPLDLREGWYLHHGGDQLEMMSLAQSIIGGTPKESVVGIGQALVMIPVILIMKPAIYNDMVVPLVIINGFIFAGHSILVTGSIARSILKRERAAIWAAAIWTLTPLAAYFAFFWHFDPSTVRSATVPTLGWLNGLADGPAMYFLLQAIMLLAAKIDDESPVSFRPLLLIGISMGLAVSFRIHALFMIIFLLLYVIIAHGWKALLIVAGGALLSYLPQAWYNQVVFGMPITTGYISYGDIGQFRGTWNRSLVDILTTLPFHPVHLVQNAWHFIERRPWLTVPSALALVVSVYVTVRLWQRHGWRAAALLIGAPLFYLIPMAAAFNFREDIIRFSMPALPMAIMLAVFGVEQLWNDISTRRGNSRSAAVEQNEAGPPPGLKENK